MNEDQYISDFAKRLYLLRQAKGQSARDMSLSMGQAPNYISGLESAKNYPAMKSFFYICEYLGITPRQFFDYGDGDPGKSDELYAELKKLDAKTKEHLLEFIRHIRKSPRSPE